MTGAARIDQVGVVIPVRNEELLLPRCLTALAVAVAAVAESPSIDRPRVTVVIVLDRCTDASASVAADWQECTRIVSSAGAVGAARRAGTARALATILDSAATGAEHVWLATTDADSAVPPNWLTAQLAFARNGAGLVLGTVVPDTDLIPAQRERWLQRHTLVEGHPHVHGANLGVRADHYLAVGGFASIETGEDVCLVAALRALPVVEAHTARIPVLTSGRLTSRAPAGFADYLQIQTTDALAP